MNEGWTQWPSYGHAFGVRLHKLRRLRGLTQDGLAEIANLSRNQISNLERNENSATKSSDPTMSTIYRLARALHVPPAALMPAVGITSLTFAKIRDTNYPSILHGLPAAKTPKNSPFSIATVTGMSSRHCSMTKTGMTTMLTTQTLVSQSCPKHPITTTLIRRRVETTQKTEGTSISATTTPLPRYFPMNEGL